MMSDVPWAVAWYGRRQCVWLTLNAQDDFYAINDVKPVQALYLTPKTMDGKLFSDMGLGMGNSWGSFVANAVVQRQIPGNFPLRYAPSGSAAIAIRAFPDRRGTLENGPSRQLDTIGFVFGCGMFPPSLCFDRAGDVPGNSLQRFGVNCAQAQNLRRRNSQIQHSRFDADL